jgi:hypothetical protein
MTTKFKPGDPVWARRDRRDYENDGQTIPPGEYAAIVTKVLRVSEFGQDYRLRLLDNPLPGVAAEPWLRPRRDDYQQHEPRVTREELDSVIRTEGPVEV